MKNKFLDDDLPPFLQDLKGKEDGLKVPEGYFEDLEEAVFNRLKASGMQGRPVLTAPKRLGIFSLTIRPRIVMALAAALTLVLTAVWYLRQPTMPLQTTQYASAELSEEDIESYLLDNVREFEPQQLAFLTPVEMVDPSDEMPPSAKPNNIPVSENIHPTDLNKILDEMTDEELEAIL